SGIDRGVVAEIEAEARRFDYASGLFDVRAENLAEGGVEQVSRGVIALGGEAFANGDFGAKLIARRDVSVGLDFVDREAGDCGIRIDDGSDFLARRDVDEAAVIADLAAGFGIE